MTFTYLKEYVERLANGSRRERKIGQGPPGGHRGIPAADRRRGQAAARPQSPHQ